MSGKGPGIAVQLYSVRDDCAKNFAGTLKAVAKMGYEGVEFAGYYGKSAQELRKMLDDLGLKAAGTHIGLDTLMGGELEKTAEFNRIIGNSFLIVPGLAPERISSISAWKETAKIFNGIAAKLKPLRMYTGYHNHIIEFKASEGQLPWDAFFSNTDASVVMQLDTGNAMHGGVKAGEILDFVKRYPARALTVHLKEFSQSNDKALLGEGDVMWKDLFKMCETIGGTMWYIVEQESYAYPPLECVEKCLQNYKRIHG